MTTIFNLGISNASSIITGNTLGTGDLEKTYKQGVSFVVLTILLGLIASVLLLIITPFVINIFEITEETARIAKQLMFATSVMMVFQAVDSTLTKGVLRGGGDTKFLMVADIMFLWLVSIPLGYFAGIVWGIPAFFVYIALKSDSIIKSIWCLKRLFSRKWLNRIEIEVDKVN
jgi:Na+-driven multidrug efflux pump